MKKLSLLLCIAMILSCFCISANAAEESLDWQTLISTELSINFDGTTGTARMVLDGVDEVNSIVATATLYYVTSRGNLSYITSWPYSVGNVLSENETFSAISGRTYTVVLEATVYMGDIEEPIRKSVSSTCP